VQLRLGDSAGRERHREGTITALLLKSLLVLIVGRQNANVAEVGSFSGFVSSPPSMARVKYQVNSVTEDEAAASPVLPFR
jgi:hypothetical protein